MLNPVDESDVVKDRKKDTGGYAGEYKKTFVRKKKEKPIRVLRIKYYDKVSLPYMNNGKMEHKDIFAVNRGLEDLLKSLYYRTDIQGMVAPSDCIYVEKDDRMGSNDKFIYANIGTNEFYTLKRQLENHTTIVAFNKGEFSILDGKMSSLAETFNMPRISRERTGAGHRHEISDTNVILKDERLREELKDELSPYHSYTDDQIDSMKESELIALKKLSGKKMAIENKKRKKIKKLLRRK